MKQFIHSSGPCIIAALNHHAYAVIPKAGHGDGDESEVQVVQLNAPQSTTNPSSNPNINQKEQTLNAVQAVASKWKPDTKELICAVSRYDKFISIYSISTDGSTASKTEMKVDPIVVHKTNKRCCALTFASIPHAKKEKDSASADNDAKYPMRTSMDIIIAGDLAGDANAFQVIPQQNIGTNMNGEGENENQSSSTSTSTPTSSQSQKSQRRLLLGHTASMVTSVTVADGKLFTSDRDEKVRITSFPRTYITEGYLLGHNAYVTDFAVLKNGNNHCVTASGDSTIRLWNFATTEELARYDFSPTPSSSSSLEQDGEDTVMVEETPVSVPDDNNDGEPESESTKSKNDEENEHDGNNDHENQTSPQNFPLGNSQIPVRVSSNRDGSIVAVIYNDHCTIDLFSVTGGKLERVQSLVCDTMPLGIGFNTDDDSDDILTILSKESSYIARYKKTDSDSKFVLMEDCAIASAIQKVGQKFDITMPDSILEVDEVTGKIKVMKKIQDESEGFVKHQPWLRGERVQMKKDKARRRKKRKLAEKHGGPPPNNAGASS